ncbi:enamine deaminase RidA (YjgF/YER057c/UK114 family) [Lentzea atacamensis]|uniref:Enamine deaminase RidA (YjgF/YER057c/UK114 family) n=1 Tax=Lentzea atacamensis TaxID=531938 RepID=A0ABX9EJ11_9PSEU|nr:RidA family protein [Lentzea atacamensis]RAS70998.1 enamine deaminase RidA (YjgF/YER057c/UK114 family) [Lentzea atacamensis]
MSITLINPDGLPTIDVYHQVAVATGTRTIYVAGQVAWDAEPDLAVQVEQAYVNVHTALKGAGASFKDLVKVTIHVVDWTPDKMPELLKGIENAMARVGETAKPPATLIGVAALDVPEHLVEIESIAVI